MAPVVNRTVGSSGDRIRETESLAANCLTCFGLTFGVLSTVVALPHVTCALGRVHGPPIQRNYSRSSTAFCAQGRLLDAPIMVRVAKRLFTPVPQKLGVLANHWGARIDSWRKMYWLGTSECWSYRPEPTLA